MQNFRRNFLYQSMWSKVNEIDTLFAPTGGLIPLTWGPVIIMVLRKIIVTKHGQKWMVVDSIRTKVCKNRLSGWSDRNEATFKILPKNFYMQRHRQLMPTRSVKWRSILCWTIWRIKWRGWIGGANENVSCSKLWFSSMDHLAT